MANQYLSEHRAELIPEAIEEARAMILSGALGKRAQRALAASRECSQSSTITNTVRT
jgi:hypothetical protein